MRYLFPTGKGYQRKWLGQDVLSGVVIAAVSIPISMGYAQIAGLPAVYGLYGSLLPVILFALLSTSPQFIFGVDAAPAAMIGGVLGGMGIAMGSAEAERVVPVLTLYVGVWLLLFALLRAGRVLRFVSTSVMGGFISGICCTIILMQLPKLMGGTAGTSDNDLQAIGAGVVRELGHEPGRAVRGNDLLVVGDAELVENIAGALHGLPVAGRSHDHRDFGLGFICHYHLLPSY